MISIRTINYAMPPPDYFWRWSADYTAIEWRDGATLALWSEVEVVLNYLAEIGGIPPLGSVLLLLAACREGEAAAERLQAWLEECLPQLNGGKTPANVLQGGGLARLRNLPREERNSLGAKCAWALAAFEGAPHRLSKPSSEEVLSELVRHRRAGLAEGGAPRYGSKNRYRIESGAFKAGFSRLDEEALRSLAETGLEDPRLRGVEILLEPEDRSERSVLERLAVAGGECAAASAVAKRAIAMISFPGQFGQPQELPVGGIADITNRGTVDRLLPGELAWDDLVLAARLVHQEALYFRREIPPLHVAVGHTVLLDRGLRLWGAARVLSLGVALGIWYHPELRKQGGTYECVAAAEDGLTYLDLQSFDEVREALKVLLPAADPAAFLQAWWDGERIIDDPAVPDVSFVTAAAHLAEEGIAQLLGQIAGWIHGRGGRFRVFALEPEGGLEAIAWLPAGHRTLFRGEIALEEILRGASGGAEAPPPLPASLRKIRLAKISPAERFRHVLPILGRKPLPILFPVHPPPASQFLKDPQGGPGGIGVTRDGRLMRWPDERPGAYELARGLEGRQCWVRRDASGSVYVIASPAKPGSPVRVYQLEDGALSELEIEASRHSYPRMAEIHGGAILLAYTDSAEAFSLKSGRRVDERKIPSYWPQVLQYDGERIQVYEGSSPALAERGSVQLLEQVARARPWVPSHITVEKGVLWIRCKDPATICRFDPEASRWVEEKGRGPSRGWVEFRSHAMEGDEFILSGAVLGQLALWHDSRGLLHLGQVDRQGVGVTMCVLLYSEAASLWSSDMGIASQAEYLKPVNQDPMIAKAVGAEFIGMMKLAAGLTDPIP